MCAESLQYKLCVCVEFEKWGASTGISDSWACLPRRGWAGCWRIWIRGSSCRCTQRRRLPCVCSLTHRSRWKDTEPRSALCHCSGDCQTRWVLNRTKEKSISSSLGRNFSPSVVETTEGKKKISHKCEASLSESWDTFLPWTSFLSVIVQRSHKLKDHEQEWHRSTGCSASSGLTSKTEMLHISLWGRWCWKAVR